jgi:diguanylate cyclase (GGDEF)-like protein/PAS domain S-box-containing protein
MGATQTDRKGIVRERIGLCSGTPFLRSAPQNKAAERRYSSQGRASGRRLFSGTSSKHMYERSSVARSTALVGLGTLGALLLLQVPIYLLVPGFSPWGLHFVAILAMSAGAAIATYFVRGRDRKRAKGEEFLRESEAQFRAIAEDVTDAIIATDNDFRIVFWNAPAARIFGYAESEVLGKSIGTLLPEDRWERYLAALGRMSLSHNSAASRTIDVRATRKDGTSFLIEAALSMRDGVKRTSQRIALTAVVRDVTERTRASQALREHVATMRAVTEGTTDAVWAKTIDGHYHLINSAGALMFGQPAHVIIGSSDVELFGLCAAETIRTRDLEALESAVATTTEAAARDTHGMMRQYVTTRTPWRDGDGSIIGLIGVSRDITDKVRAERALRTSEERYRQLVEQSPEAIIVHRDGGLLYINKTGAEILGASDADTFIGRPISSFVHTDSQARLVDAVAARTRGEFSAKPVEYRIVTSDGRTADVEALSVAVEHNGTPAIQTVLRDVTARRAAESALRDREARLNLVMHQIPAVLWATDCSGRFTSALGAGLNALGIGAEQLVGTHARDQFGAAGDTDQELSAVSTALRGDSAAFELAWAGRSFACSVEPLRASSGEIEGALGLAVDITERKVLETQLTYRAFHDPLTGLANRALFRDRVMHALSRIGRGKHVAILFLDLDDFKTVNDSLGHTEGDRLLAAVGSRLVGAVRSHDTVARFGGDEFAILLEELVSAEEALDVVARVEESLRAPIGLRGREVNVTASVGLAHAAPGDAADEILRNADVAMYCSKESGSGRHTVFEPRMHAAIVDRLELESDLRGALDREELHLLYQPVVSLASGEIEGFEALSRWSHRSRGELAPQHFIQLAEDTGLIVQIGRWVINNACDELVRWHALARNGAQGLHSDLRMGINISGSQLEHESFVPDVADALARSGAPASRVVLELTEGTLMRRTAETLKRLHALKELGVQLAIDDFGTGYSSLSYLQRFPIDVLKVDKAFVEGIARSGGDGALARTILALGEMMKVRTLAEGIETQEQCDALIALGCRFGQGYLFSRPMDGRDVAAWAAGQAARWESRRTARRPATSHANSGRAPK